MRIGFDAKRYFHNKTGLGNYSRSIVHALARQYPESEFSLFDNKAGKPQADFANIKVCNAKGKTPLWRMLGMSHDASLNKIQVFHGLSNEIPLGLKKHKIPAVVTIHDVIFKRFPDYYPFIDRAIYHQKTRYAVNHADIIIATSQATADDLMEYYQADEKRIRVVYQPVQESWYQTEAGENPVKGDYFLYVSSFTGRKNHSILIEAFSLIKHQTDAMLVLAGSKGETLEQCKRFVEYEKLKDRVLFFEDCSQTLLSQLMQHAAGFVYPSHFEGFGIPLVEAAVKKLPMAVSDIAVFRELAGDAAIYFNPNKADDIADKMLEILRGENKTVVESGREALLKKIEPAKIAEDLMTVYSGMIN